jgi:hypothetical protein
LAHNRFAAPLAIGLAAGLLIGVPAVDAAQQVLFARNAAHVNGIAASWSGKPRTLIPLGQSGQFAQKVIPHQTVLVGGQTVTGVVGGTFTATTANQVFSASASIFPAAPRVIAVTTSGVDNTAAENPFCDGTVDKPTAPQGLLCVYLATDQLVNVVQDCSPGPFPNCASGEGYYSVFFDPVNNSKYGFVLKWTAKAPGATTVYGAWAYTAPVKGATPGATPGAGDGTD